MHIHPIYKIPNYNQQDATFLDLSIFTEALHVSGDSSVHHQEHNYTYSFRYCQTALLLAATVEDEFHLLHGSS
jgi:hypothetical protein